MARFILNSRTGPVEFFVPDAGGYVRLESGAEHGTLGRQLCAGGRFHGDALTATAATLESVARRWYRAWRAHRRAL